MTDLTQTPGPGSARPRSRSRWLLVGLAIVSLLGFEAWRTFTVAPGIRAGPRTVAIPRDMGVIPIARRLSDAQVIRSPWGFVVLATLRGAARRLKAGEYEVPRGAAAPAILSLLESGRVLQRTVLLREGGTLTELARALEAQDLVAAAEVLRVARDPAFLRSLGVEADSLEGYLFPDTYQVVRGMTPQEILSRMVARMREHVTGALIERARARGLSLHQLLTLASIIERETPAPAELRLVSAVFWNRLKRDMPLQADPTVQYAVGKEGRALSREDLQADSPYNTYRRTGLPPGPIASAGRAALEAAVNPAPVPYLYFVAMNDNEHRFATTLAEHNANVLRFRNSKGR